MTAYRPGGSGYKANSCHAQRSVDQGFAGRLAFINQDAFGSDASRRSNCPTGSTFPGKQADARASEQRFAAVAL